MDNNEVNRLRKEAFLEVKHKMATVRVPEGLTLEHLQLILSWLGGYDEQRRS